jgi:hypothetical protein
MNVKYFAMILSLALLTPTSHLMAQGDVVVEVDDNGNLTVEGNDDDPEFIFVEASVAPGRFIFSDPELGTTFNGLAELTVDNVFGDMEFDLGEGDNILILDDGAASDFCVLGDLDITAKGNSSTIVLIDDANVDGRTRITTKNGSDSVILLESDFEVISVKTGKGDDVFGAVGSTADFNDDVNANMGSDNDAIVFQEARFFAELNAKLGSGDDAAIAMETDFDAKTVINGNGGLDVFGEEASIAALGITLKSIEDGDADAGDLTDDLLLENAVFAQAIDLIDDFNLG